jgi:hypothetical protein
MAESEGLVRTRAQEEETQAELREAIGASIRRSVVTVLAVLVSMGTATWAAPSLPAQALPFFCFSVRLAGPDKWSAEIVIEEFSRGLGYVPSPLVLWLDPSLKGNVTFGYDYNRPFADQLEAMSEILGTCQENQHGSFHEVAWADDVAYARIRRGMGEVVPSIVLAANDPNCFPDMWSPVSGLRIAYEKRKLPLAASRWFPPDFALLAPDAAYWAFSQPGAVVFAVRTPTPIDDFMELLAAQVDCFAERQGDDWRFVPISEREARPKRIRKLLAQVEKDPYAFGLGTPGRALMALGKQALPDTLAAFETAEDYHLLALTNILAQIDSPERDKAFLEWLDAFARDPDKFWTTTFVSVMMETLGESGCAEAIPVLERIAGQGDAHLASRAKIALNRLDHPAPVTDAEDCVTFANDLDTGLPHYAPLREALAALAGHGLLWPEGKIQLDGAIKNDADGLTFLGHGVSDKGSHWELRLSNPDGGEVSVVHTSHGTSHDVCFVGLLQYRDGRWLPVRWRYFSSGLYSW